MTDIKELVREIREKRVSVGLLHMADEEVYPADVVDKLLEIMENAYQYNMETVPYPPLTIERGRRIVLVIDTPLTLRAAAERVLDIFMPTHTDPSESACRRLLALKAALEREDK